ncbi:hypothetical protein CPB83DRAFT_911394 [Crepidotus variabilis]|uniref:Uncharacterized protein n=1 Tax=Crepidotus variabilis TaxID=179855 RepID=A0A9P6JIU0_9AGAR|nr:hypothetical protein CPB83DRAFT_911394 [Crepidotus variabilis]
MPHKPLIDDNDTTLITYNGDWAYLTGSTRQHAGGVHVTGQAGATATFSFRGYQVWVRGTIPRGSGSNSIDITLDGQTTSSGRQSGDQAVYNEVYYTSPILSNTFHTIVITNRGSVQNGQTEFQLDYFEFNTDDNPALFTPSSPNAAPPPPDSTQITTGKPATTIQTTAQSVDTDINGKVTTVIFNQATTIGAATTTASRKTSTDAVPKFTTVISGQVITITPSGTTSTIDPSHTRSTDPPVVQKKGVPVAYLVGGIAGGIVLLLAAILLGVLVRRRQTKRNNPSLLRTERRAQDRSIRVSPYMLPSSGSNGSLPEKYLLAHSENNSSTHIPFSGGDSSASTSPISIEQSENPREPPPSYDTTPTVTTDPA